jgi:hypothetical protein
MSIETEYKGFKIIFRDNSEEWSCPSADYSSASLAAVKRKIDTIDRARRKAGAVPALRVGDRGGIEEVTVVEYTGATKSRWRDQIEHSVYVIGASRHGDKTAVRSKGLLAEFCADTPENRAALTAIANMRAEIIRIEKAIQEAKSAIPKLTVEQVAHLAVGEDES